MIQLIYQECKKLFKKRANWILLFITIIFGFTFMNANSEEGIFNAKTTLSDTVKDYTGTIDEAWADKAQQDADKQYIADILSTADEKMMNELYQDSDWKATFTKNPDNYTVLSIENIEKGATPDEGKKLFAVKQFYLSEKHDELMKMVNYANLTVRKPWIDDTKEIVKDANGKEMEVSSVFGKTYTDEKEKQWLIDQLNSNQTYVYDNYDGWKDLVVGMSTTRFFLAILIIFATCRIFNEDRSIDLNEVVATTTYGKKKMAFAKLISTAIFAIAAVVLYTFSFTLLIALTEGLGNWNVNLSIVYNTVNPYTFQQAYIGGILSLLAGSICISFLSATFSIFIKKNYISFVVALVVFIIPSLLPSKLATLTPVTYMDFANTYLSNDPFSFLGELYKSQPFIYASAAIALLICSIACIQYYRSYHYTKD